MAHDHDRGLHALLRNRWSPKEFADRPIAPATLTSLFEAARWAPSSYNEQPWRFIYVTRETPARFAQVLDALMPRNQAWAQHAPVLVVGAAKQFLDYKRRTNRYAEYDVGQAVAHLTVQATAEGLSVHQMGGFRADTLRSNLAIPSDYTPLVVMAVGYLEEPVDHAERQERHPVRRTRHPLQDLVFEGAWKEEPAETNQ